MSGYADQEDLDKLKAWWKNYGNSLVIGVVMGGAILIGFRYWTQYTEQQSQGASIVYEQMLQNFRSQNAEAVRKAGESLMKEYSSTPYAGMAALLLARMDYIAGDQKTSRQHLQWAVDHADDAATVHAARLRLARLYFDDGDQDVAMSLLKIKDQTGFESEYAELHGDIYKAQGDRDQAREAYRKAINHLAPDSSYAPILNMKLDDLGPEKPQ